jgi:DNA-binding transcriptional regulator GbsR (MarR family)
MAIALLFYKKNMDWKEGKDKFIQAWGALGTEWGINRTMAQIHALLMIAPNSLSAEEITKELKISVGNANMNIRSLMDWGLVYKELKAGERKEFFIAEKDMWKVVRQIIINRKKRELEPMLKILEEISDIKEDSEEAVALMKAVHDIKMFSSKADSTLDMLIKADSNWFVGTFMKMIK